jgi:hypothetical protein
MRNLGITPGSSAKRKSGWLPPATPGSPNGGAAAAAAAADGAGTPAANGTPAAAAAAAADGAGSSKAAAAAGDGASVARAAAAAALAAAKEAATGGVGRSYNKVTITETRRFAGKDLQVRVSRQGKGKGKQQATQVTSGSRQACRNRTVYKALA